MLQTRSAVLYPVIGPILTYKNVYDLHQWQQCRLMAVVVNPSGLYPGFSDPYLGRYSRINYVTQVSDLRVTLIYQSLLLDSGWAMKTWTSLPVG